MVSHRCSKCRWFDHQHESLNDVPDNFGYCRKHKPMVYQIERRFYGAWPLVDVNDLCGEFRLDEDGG